MRLIICILLLLPCFQFAQQPVIQWQKTYGSSGQDIPGNIKPTPDGGFIFISTAFKNDGDISGVQYYYAEWGSEFWVVKCDANGNVQWKSCYGGLYNESAYDIELTSDGGYILIGRSNSDGSEIGYTQWDDVF